MRSIVLVSIPLFGCAELPPLALPEGCQPLLAGLDCMLPYPSSAFEVPDPSTPSGRRVVLEGAARLVTEEGASANVHDVWSPDGASRVPSVVLLFARPPDPRGLVGVSDDPARSLEPSARTILLDVERGVPIPHYVDLDARAEDGAPRAVVLQPLVRLAAGARHVVGVRGLVDASGAPLPAPEGFRRLRDGEGGRELAGLAERFERDVFPALGGAGFAREELQLAFDFHTGSDAHPKADLLAVRAKTEALLAAGPPEVRIAAVEESPDGPMWRRIRGTFLAPAFVDSPEPGARLRRGPAGEVVAEGTLEVPFVLHLPAAARAAPVRMIAYGHGFLGAREETDLAPFQEFAARSGSAIAAIDWIGMSRGDIPHLVEVLGTRPAELGALVDRVHQAFANWLVFQRALETSIADQPELAAAHGPAYDRARVHFLGISGGHILGGTLAAIARDVDRYAFQVGGAGFGHIIFRSRPFLPLLFFADAAMPRALDHRKFIALLGEHFDKLDPATWAEHVIAAPLDGGRRKQVLMQVGLGDSEVPNAASFLHARLLGIPLVVPSPVGVYGLTEARGPVDSGLELFDFGVDPGVYEEAKPGEVGTGVHGRVMRLPAVQAQLPVFYDEGRVVHPCEGPCRADP